MKSINGIEALRRMKSVSMTKDGSFTMIHLTANLKDRTTRGARKIERCRFRKSLPADTFSVHSDHYVSYEDMNTEDVKLCFKWLIRYVAFAPKYELLKVNWL